MTAASLASSSPKPRLLVIRHIYAEDISVRELEFARRLADRFDLKWRDALHVDAASQSSSVASNSSPWLCLPHSVH